MGGTKPPNRNMIHKEKIFKVGFQKINQVKVVSKAQKKWGGGPLRT